MVVSESGWSFGPAPSLLIYLHQPLLRDKPKHGVIWWITNTHRTQTLKIAQTLQGLFLHKETEAGRGGEMSWWDSLICTKEGTGGERRRESVPRGTWATVILGQRSTDWGRASCAGLPGSKAKGGDQRPLKRGGSFGNKLGSQKGQTGPSVASCKRTFSVASRCALSLPSDPDATTCLAWRAM